MQFLHSIDVCRLACCSFRASQSIHVCCVAAQSSCVEAHAAVWAHCTAKHKGRATQRAQAHAAVFARSTVSPDFQCTRAVAHFSSLCLRISDAPDYRVSWTLNTACILYIYISISSTQAAWHTSHCTVSDAPDYSCDPTSSYPCTQGT